MAGMKPRTNPMLLLDWGTSTSYVVSLQNFFILLSFAAAGTCCHHCVSVRGQSLTLGQVGLQAHLYCTHTRLTIFQAIPQTSLVLQASLFTSQYLRLTPHRVHLNYKPPNISPALPPTHAQHTLSVTMAQFIHWMHILNWTQRKYWMILWIGWDMQTFPNCSKN